MATESTQKWEYYFISCMGAKVDVVNGKDMPKPWPNTVEYINKLGEEGWELVSVYGNTYAFKRPK